MLRDGPGGSAEEGAQGLGEKDDMQQKMPVVVSSSWSNEKGWVAVGWEDSPATLLRARGAVRSEQ